MAAAERLFHEKGYSKTTMRQIAQKAGMLVGSVYNVFPSKEEVFMELIDVAYGKALDQYDRYVKSEDNILAAVAFPMALELYSVNSSERAAELLHEAHGSWLVVNAMADRTVEWVMERMGKYGLKEDPADVKNRVVALLGVLGNIISRKHLAGEGDYLGDLKMALEVFCALFKIQAYDLDAVVAEMDGILRENDIVIGGYRV